ncbi:MAG TPA: transglycosylase domain-containing protein [Stellaceae bacterium]|nr:transglycosylase domain-containing protein [Stellaceae bacterium]
MAIVDTVWGRLTRFNAPHSPTDRKRRFFTVLGAVRAARWLTLAAVLAGIAWAAAWEMRTSRIEAWLFARLDRTMDYSVKPGASPAIEFPKTGPYDARYGYSELPDFISALEAHRYRIDSQAQWSPGLLRFVNLGAYPIYREKDQAGLRIYDRTGNQIYAAWFPRWAYQKFDSIPPLAVKTLTFIEDRYLFDPHEPDRNPAIEWKRFAQAAAGRVLGLVFPNLRDGGGSTLATQIEKFRHSYHGLTLGVGAKMRQMLTATARAYRGGPNTLKERERILTRYMDSTPLASMPGYGEVIGIPEALWIWFGTDYTKAAKVLDRTPNTPAELAHKGLIYRQLLSLVLSERRPTYYLVQDRNALAALTDASLKMLSDAGIISPRLRDAALGAELHFRTDPPPVNPASDVHEKAADDIRNKLVGLLDLPDLYALDRLDMSAETSIDTAAQNRVLAVMQQLGDEDFLEQHGMVGKQLLGGGDPSKVTWSFVLYERGSDRNYVRIHADSLNTPFDLNSGAKLQLGSTAKLRTLITYLDIISVIHDRFAPLAHNQLVYIENHASDALTRWGAQYLLRNGDQGLQAMLDAAMQRTYSAAPASFFTGGGMQSFGNFTRSEDYETPTVEVAFQHSINLSFVRLLKDVVDYYVAASGVKIDELLGNPDDPKRQAYLQRFVDADSKRFMYRFYKDYGQMSGAQALDELADRVDPSPKKLATIYLSANPHARIAQFQAFLLKHLPGVVITKDELWELYLGYSPRKFDLNDRAYIAGVHPLELWLVRYLQDHSKPSWKQVLKDSAKVRQQSYAWLFNGSIHKQDVRIRILLQQDAFDGIWQNWHAVGYPFAHLVPSLGTVVGASGDRPDALATLMGIIMHDGVRVPSVTIEHLHFATGTPYETNMSPAAKPVRVMPAAVAKTVRNALGAVVADGTASRLRGAYVEADGTPLPVGGKTGTGDNRFDTFARGGGIASSRVVDRTAAFVFFLGDRFYGTVTVYVPGKDAADFDFTSALAVQLLKVLKPELQPLLSTATASAAPAGPAKSRS